MNRKFGESQVINSFSVFLEREIKAKFGEGAHYSFGNFSGSQDRKFADVFAGTASSCILIEFKEFESEIKHEYVKELRRDLCLLLNSEIALLSRKCHFIGYRDNSGPEMKILLVPYVDRVCGNFSVGTPPLALIKEFKHKNFISSFVDGNAGVNHSDFQRYVGIMSALANGTSDGKKTAFKSVLYSNDEEGEVKATMFKTLGDFEKLMQLNPTTRRPRP